MFGKMKNNYYTLKKNQIAFEKKFTSLGWAHPINQNGINVLTKSE